jgi:SAM-dependent methyltransferase
MARPSERRDTGERVYPEPHNTLYLEHLSAYEKARRLPRVGFALDIGCGAGYGSRHLSSTARRVLGIDRDPSLVNDAARQYRDAQTDFSCMDATKIGVRSRSASLVTCFQVVEHLPDPEALIAEMARTLHPHGVALLSTPNALTHRGPRNPFHCREFAPEELRRLLARHFAFVELAGQRRPAYVYELEAACKPLRDWDRWRIRGWLPRRLVPLLITLAARRRGLAPPQQLPLSAFRISRSTTDAYSLFGLCGHAPAHDCLPHLLDEP